MTRLAPSGTTTGVATSEGRITSVVGQWEGDTWAMVKARYATWQDVKDANATWAEVLF